MLDTPSFSSPKTWGIPIAAPTVDYNAISHTLSEMVRAHPGQFFIVEDVSSEQGLGAVVTWIPPWAAQNIVMQAFSLALLPNSDREWPTIR